MDVSAIYASVYFRMAVDTKVSEKVYSPPTQKKESVSGILSVLNKAAQQPYKGKSTAACWNEIPEDVYAQADAAGLEGGEYPPGEALYCLTFRT